MPVINDLKSVVLPDPNTTGVVSVGIWLSSLAIRAPRTLANSCTAMKVSTI
jgi:hypothetical protein